MLGGPRERSGFPPPSGRVTPPLCGLVLLRRSQEEEWNAAQEYAADFVLAVVDFFGSPKQRIFYLRDPAANVTPVERSTVIYRIPRAEVLPLSTTAEFL